MATWHIVSNTEGTILSVWGEALLKDAQESARRIENATGCPTWTRHVELASMPRCGESISMVNAKPSFPTPDERRAMLKAHQCTCIQCKRHRQALESEPE